VLSLVLDIDEIDVAGDPRLSGQVEAPDGTRWPFVGVLELIAVVERLVDARRTDPGG
jgi:hypothetical protein